MLLPLQGVGCWVLEYTQGVALGYVLLPLRGVQMIGPSDIPRAPAWAAFFCPFGAWDGMCPGYPQGASLGCVLLPLRGVPLWYN